MKAVLHTAAHLQYIHHIGRSDTGVTATTPVASNQPARKPSRLACFRQEITLCAPQIYACPITGLVFSFSFMSRLELSKRLSHVRHAGALRRAPRRRRCRTARV